MKKEKINMTLMCISVSITIIVIIEKKIMKWGEIKLNKRKRNQIDKEKEANKKQKFMNPNIPNTRIYSTNQKVIDILIIMMKTKIILIKIISIITEAEVKEETNRIMLAIIIAAAKVNMTENMIIAYKRIEIKTTSPSMLITIMMNIITTEINLMIKNSRLSPITSLMTNHTT